MKFLSELMATWAVGHAELACLLGYEEAEIPALEALLAGRKTLSGRDRKDRIATLMVIRRTLSALFRDAEVERDWLRRAQDDLDGKSVMEMMLYGSMTALLSARQFVEQTAGL